LTFIVSAVMKPASRLARQQTAKAMSEIELCVGPSKESESPAQAPMSFTFAFPWQRCVRAISSAGVAKLTGKVIAYLVVVGTVFCLV